MRYTEVKEFPVFENLKHLSLRQIAKETGLDASTVLRLKQGKSAATFETFEKLLKLVEQRPSDISASQP